MAHICDNNKFVDLEKVSLNLNQNSDQKNSSSLEFFTRLSLELEVLVNITNSRLDLTQTPNFYRKLNTRPHSLLDSFLKPQHFWNTRNRVWNLTSDFPVGRDPAKPGRSRNVFWLSFKNREKTQIFRFLRKQFFVGIFEVDFNETLHRKSSIITDASELVDSTILFFKNSTKWALIFNRTKEAQLLKFLPQLTQLHWGRRFSTNQTELSQIRK